MIRYMTGALTDFNIQNYNIILANFIDESLAFPLKSFLAREYPIPLGEYDFSIILL